MLFSEFIGDQDIITGNVTGSLFADVISANTINANRITANTITAAQIQADAITVAQINARASQNSYKSLIVEEAQAFMWITIVETQN